MRKNTIEKKPSKNQIKQRKEKSNEVYIKELLFKCENALQYYSHVSISGEIKKLLLGKPEE
jgi:hypothetical protein